MTEDGDNIKLTNLQIVSPPPDNIPIIESLDLEVNKINLFKNIFI